MKVTIGVLGFVVLSYLGVGCGEETLDSCGPVGIHVCNDNELYLCTGNEGDQMGPAEFVRDCSDDNLVCASDAYDHGHIAGCTHEDCERPCFEEGWTTCRLGRLILTCSKVDENCLTMETTGDCSDSQQECSYSADVATCVDPK